MNYTVRMTTTMPSTTRTANEIRGNADNSGVSSRTNILGTLGQSRVLPSYADVAGASPVAAPFQLHAHVAALAVEDRSAVLVRLFSKCGDFLHANVRIKMTKVTAGVNLGAPSKQQGGGLGRHDRNEGPK